MTITTNVTVSNTYEDDIGMMIRDTYKFKFHENGDATKVKVSRHDVTGTFSETIFQDREIDMEDVPEYIMEDVRSYLSCALHEVAT